VTDAPESPPPAPRAPLPPPDREPPPIALTCGEPAGIGPELAAKAWETLGPSLPFAWIGDPRHLPRGVPVARIDDPSEARAAAARALPVLERRFPERGRPGRPSAANAQAVVDAVAEAVRLASEGAVSALCTAPIHKAALQEGCGFPHPGHTEFLAALTGAERVVMMLACDELRVVPATIHIPVFEVAMRLTPDLLEGTLRTVHEALRRDFGLDRPRIAVAGLNPHAGEGGHIGREEIDVIVPVLDRLRTEGMVLLGPLSADTLFHADARRRYDCAVAMYHDQALIPIKTIDFAGGVNVTLGLPIVRTSPDHGTALDIAGTGTADPTSTIAALVLADDIARARSRAAAPAEA
jgi:4-hydroxythreonine-4-phosphate dehydrogenase